MSWASDPLLVMGSSQALGPLLPHTIMEWPGCHGHPQGQQGTRLVVKHSVQDPGKYSRTKINPEASYVAN